MTVPPGPPTEGTRDDEPSGQFNLDGANVVGILVPDRDELKFVVDAVREAGHVSGAAEVETIARVLVVDAEKDPGGSVRALRRSARADAAIVAILGKDASEEAAAEARAAGAFSCIRRPLVRAELLRVLQAACVERVSRTRIADPTRQIDLQSYLASIGRFTAGLLHELQNPLAVVEMNTNLVREDLPPTLEARTHLRGVLSAPAAERTVRERAAAQYLAETEPRVGDLGAALEDARIGLARIRVLLARLHEFARRKDQTLEPLDVGSVVREIRSSMSAALEGVDVEVVTESTAQAYASRSLLEAIVQNVALNAAQAARTLPSPRVRFHVYESGETVVLSVRDNGPGIPVESQEKIFEPFHTTRRDSGGVGLGLAVCREYAALMGAPLSLWSIPGRGACFRLHLRRA
jgi:signal transduction histidine kinase